MSSVVAVVGGGMAGVAAAKVLCQQGYHVRLYEREERLGGRLGNVELGKDPVGLGATYVKAKDPLFKAEMTKLLEKGLVSEWNAGTPYFIEAPGSFVAKPELKNPADVWYVGRPDMGSFVLLEDCDRLTRLCGKEVYSVQWDQGSWLINGEDQVASLILALPVAQTRALLAPGSLEELLPKETLDKDFEKGRVAAAFAFPTTLQLPFCLAFVKDSPISLVLNDTSRRPRSAREVEVWVVQTTTEWAADCQKDGTSEDEMCRSLLAEFLRILGREILPVDHLKAIHWLYGDGDYQLPKGFATDPSRRLSLCGDWCYNGRVEGAFLSGVKAAAGLSETE